MSGGHSGEAIPVPIPNTEVKLSNADDTAFVVGKQVAARLFFSFNNFHGLAATYGVNRIDGLRVRKMVNPKKSYCRMIFFNGFAIEHKLPDFFYLTRICSGGKVRMRAERQNCDSNFSRLARQRRLPAVAARLFFPFNIYLWGCKLPTA